MEKKKNETDSSLQVEDLLSEKTKHVSSIAIEREPIYVKWLRSSAFWIFVIILFMVIIFGILTPHNVFFRPNTLLTIGLNASQMIVIAVGISYLLGAGEIDLSVGTNIILSSTLAARTLKFISGTPEQVMRGEYPHLTAGIIMGVLVAIIVGLFCGLLNGLIITKLNINSFITTLGTMMMYWGTSLVISHGAAEVGIPRALQTGFGHKKLLNYFPLPLVLAIVISIILWVIMDKTKFGLYTTAIGSSQEAARRSGVKVDRHRMKLYALVGMLAGIAGLFDLTRFATTNPQGHQTDGLMAITAAVMGGTSMWGGVASIGGTMLGTLVPVTLQTGLVILRVGAFYQLIGTGAFLIIAVYLDKKRKEE